MTSLSKKTKPQLSIETRSISRQSFSSSGYSPTLLSPKDKKSKTNFPLSPALEMELERLKRTYSKTEEKTTKLPPEERQLKKIPSSNAIKRSGNVNTKFRSLGGKVTSLLRVRKAFATSNKDEDDIITTTKTLPIEPRFSSSLSPAAQFAMMKGYEDAVYNNLCKHYPASKLFLKRSKTPPKARIDINDIGKLKEPTIPEDDPSDFENADENNGNGQALHSILLLRRSNGTLTSRSLSTNGSYESRVHSSHRRVSLARTRSESFIQPNIVPRQKRLILSQRLQSAMDILDTVRGNVGQNSISPRINKYPRQIQPVSDFNQWSSIWSAEFKISRA